MNAAPNAADDRIAAAEAVAQALRALAPSDVRVGALAVEPAHMAALQGAEIAAVARAVPRRRHEFATGRALLRQLLNHDIEIPVAASRAPQFSTGVRGTLAHDRDIAIAAVCESNVAAALGIDLESVGSMNGDESALVLRSDDDRVDPRLAFVLKESAYKAWSGLGGELIDFLDVRLTVRGGRFTATMPRSTKLDGRWSHAADRWVALVVAPSHIGRLAPHSA